MKPMKKLLSLFLLMAFASALVLPDIDISVSSVKGDVAPSETGKFNILLANRENESITMYFLIAGSRTSWIQTYTYYHTVGGGDSVLVPIDILPATDTKPGKYDFTILAKAKINGVWRDLIPETFTLNVIESSGAAPTVPRVAGQSLVEVYSDTAEYEPSSVVSLSMRVSDLGAVYKELRASIRLQDTYGNPIYQYLMPISSQEEPIVLMHSFALDSRMPPGDYVIFADIISERGKLGSGSAPITVKAVSNVEIKKDAQIGVMKKTLIMRAINQGNVPAQGNIDEPIRWYEKWLISASPAPDAMMDSGESIILRWTYSDLQPEQSTPIILFSISYVPIVLLFVVIILLLVVAWQGVKTVSIRKEVVRQAIGNILNVEMGLTIRNLTDQTMKSVVVIEKLPMMAAPTAYETLKPAAEKKEHDGVKIEWDIGDLKPLEERVIHYHFSTRFGIIGTIDLGPAEVRFTLPDGRRQSSKSNETTCGVIE